MKKKILLAGFGIFSAFLLIEISMRLAGLFLNMQSAFFGGSFHPNQKSLRILCIGESTTAPWIDDGKDISWPAQLQTILNKRYPNIPIQIINKGRFGTPSSFVTAKLPDYIDLYHPQIIVSMLGVNDNQWYGIVKLNPGIWGSLYKFLSYFKTWKLLRYFYYEGWKRFHLVSTSDTPALPPPTPELSRCLSLGKNPLSHPTQLLAVCKKEARLYPRDPRPYDMIGRLRIFQSRYRSARKWQEKAFKLGSIDSITVSWVGEGYFDNGMSSTTNRAALKRCVDITINDPGDGCLLTLLNSDETIKEKKDKKLQEALYRQAISIDPDWTGGLISVRGSQGPKPGLESPVTEANYHEIYRLTQSHHILWIAMQYARRNVNQIQSMLKGRPGIIFISNKESFDKALVHGKYSDYFSDNFGGNWGHCTKKGNHIIAENVAKTLKPLIQKIRR